METSEQKRRSRGMTLQCENVLGLYSVASVLCLHICSPELWPPSYGFLLGEETRPFPSSAVAAEAVLARAGHVPGELWPGRQPPTGFSFHLGEEGGRWGSQRQAGQQADAFSSLSRVLDYWECWG